MRAPGVQAGALLIVAALLGGGGVGFGLMNLAVQLLALSLLAVNGAAMRAFWQEGPRALVWLAGFSIALPLLQSVPLPPALWQALPGRDLVTESFALAGLEERWFTWSVNPWRTMGAALALIPPLAMLVLVMQCDARERRALIMMLVWLALASLLAGAVQVLSENRHGNLYPGASGPILFGFFANRNSAGLFLAIALPATLFAARERHWLTGPARFVIAALIVLGVLLTQSRSALLLAGVVGLAWLTHRPWRTLSLTRAQTLLGAVLGSALLLGAGALALQNDRLGATVERFGQTRFNRPEIWEDGLFAARRYWPVGSGMGTFDEVFQVDESLEYLMPARAGRAHNDYLEIAIEAGLPGIALALAWLVWLGRAGWQLRKSGSRTASAATVGLVLIALQSSIDYPMRNQAILCIAALLAALTALEKAHDLGEHK